jgi:DNA-directed RNA polymerase specialized sigma24 family protein
MRSEMQRLLTEAIRNLTERERLVITFYYRESMNDKEISLILESGPADIRSRCAHAHRHQSLHRKSDPDRASGKIFAIQPFGSFERA